MFKKIVLILGVIILSSCYYTPDSFNADVIVDDQGRFSMVYDGDLIRVPYVKELKDGKVAPENVREKIDLIKKDLERDPAFSEIISMGQGRFKVKYKRTGVLAPNQILSFIRRDSMIFRLVTSNDEGTSYEVNFKGRYLTPDKQKQLLDLGIHINGTFRFATNAEVINHNAMKVTENAKGFGGGVIYEWDIKDFENPTPMLVLKLKNNK